MNAVLDFEVSFVRSPCGLSGRLGVPAMSTVARGRKPGPGAAQGMIVRVLTQSQKNKIAQWSLVDLITNSGNHGDLVQSPVTQECKLELEIA